MSRPFVPLVLLIAATLSATVSMTGCARPVAGPPSTAVPASCSSNEGMNGLHFSFTRWDERSAVLMVDNLQGSTLSKGTLTEVQYQYRVKRTSPSGEELNWQITTRDGKSGRLVINDRNYDLNRGRLFAAKRVADGLRIEQFDLDLTALECRIPVVTQFVNSCVPLQEFLSQPRHGAPPSSDSTATPPVAVPDTAAGLHSDSTGHGQKAVPSGDPAQ